LSSTPMPSYRDSLSQQDRWALAYYVLSLSAFKDPLTGEPLKISDTDRKALDDPKLGMGSPDDPYVPGRVSGRTAAASDIALPKPTRTMAQSEGPVPHKSE